MIVRPAERLDPSRRSEVLTHTLAPRYLAIGDVADEDVPERVLRLPGDGRSPLTPEKFLPLEGVQAVLE
jgi:hypothetical protein